MWEWVRWPVAGFLSGAFVVIVNPHLSTWRAIVAVMLLLCIIELIQKKSKAH